MQFHTLDPEALYVFYTTSAPKQPSDVFTTLLYVGSLLTSGVSAAVCRVEFILLCGFVLPAAPPAAL